VPTIVHTLVSPMSTCHNAPDEAPVSLEDPRRPEGVEPADVGRRLPLETGFFDIPPALDVDRFPFFTFPPSFEKSLDDDGEAGSLIAPPLPCPK